MNVMEILASNGQGLGEVLRDYAQQTHIQMNELFHSVNQLVKGAADTDDLEILKDAHFVLSSAATVLDMTPAAMLRNRAEIVGAREKIAHEEIVRITRSFRQAPEVIALMQSQEATEHLLIGAVNASADSRKLPLLSTALMPRAEARN
jgi:plasmid maintenance system antidote protein VapI